MSVVLYEKRRRIAHVTINRPQQMNAIDAEVSTLLSEAWRDFESDPDLWVAILSGAGERAFCSGADLKKVYGRWREEDLSSFREALSPSTEGLTKPVIAAINGYCLAGGLELALGCDIRIASETASFGCPEVRWGLLHGYGALRYPHLIPLSVATEMLLTGERIGAREAYRIGLVSRVVPAEELRPTAEAIARTICQNAPLAVRAIKKLLESGADLPLEQGLKLYATLNAQVMASDDALEGPRAFAEKRKPVFRGS